MKEISKYKAISFDWDGVITVRGEALKRLAWEDLAKKEGKKFTEVLSKYYREVEGGKGSRYDILRNTLKDLGVPFSSIENEVEKYANKYQSEVMKLMTSDVREGVSNLLSFLASGANLYVNSATAEDGLKLSADKLGLSGFFKKIYGYPVDGSCRTKADVLRLIMKDENNASPAQVLHVGDGLNDLAASKETGCGFLAVGNNENGWRKDKIDGYPVITNLESIKDFL